MCSLGQQTQTYRLANSISADAELLSCAVKSVFRPLTVGLLQCDCPVAGKRLRGLCAGRCWDPLIVSEAQEEKERVKRN